MTALLFALSHRQYFIVSPLGIGMILALFVGSLFAGYARYRFGTLMPGILAHALGNLPLRGMGHVVFLVAMIGIIIIARRRIAAHLRELARLLRTRTILPAIAVALSP